MSWDELAGIASGARYTIKDADELIERAASEALAEWGRNVRPLPKL